MLGLNNSLKVFLAVEPVDLRKSFNGLYSEVLNRLEEDPCSGALFVFTNKRRNRIKTLYWDRTGLWIAMKRLEKGCFSWPKSVPEKNGQKLKLAPEALGLLLDGIELKDACKKAWYQR